MVCETVVTYFTFWVLAEGFCIGFGIGVLAMWIANKRYIKLVFRGYEP